MVVGHLHIKNALGIRGEEMAVKVLEDKGFTILERNWKLEHKEIDIIAANKETIVFAEVKCRTSLFAGSPEQCVTADKKRNLLFAAKVYMKMHKEERLPRFDIIGILLHQQTGELQELTHLENAFQSSARTINSGSYNGQYQWQSKGYHKRHGF